MYDITHTSWIFVAENLANHIRLPPPLLCKQCGGLSYWLAIKWSWKEMERCSSSGQKWKILCFLHSFKLRLNSWKGLFFFLPLRSRMMLHFTWCMRVCFIMCASDGSCLFLVFFCCCCCGSHKKKKKKRGVKECQVVSRCIWPEIVWWHELTLQQKGWSVWCHLEHKRTPVAATPEMLQQQPLQFPRAER